MQTNSHLLFISVSTALVTILTSGWSQAQVVDSVSIEPGVGMKSTQLKLAVQRGWCADCPILSERDLKALVEFSVARIDENEYQGVLGWSHALTVFGVTPVLRWHGASLLGSYVELGVGPNYMSDYYENRGRISSTKFQFGDHLSWGVPLSDHVDFSVKFQHYSNADIKEPNPAINFISVKLLYQF